MALEMIKLFLSIDYISYILYPICENAQLPYHRFVFRKLLFCSLKSEILKQNPHLINMNSKINTRNLQIDNPQHNSSLNFFSDMIEHPQSQRNKQGLLLQPYYTNRSMKSSKEPNALGILESLLLGIEQKSAQNFQKTFAYGVQMQMWRKQKLKPVMVFVDPNLPNFVWFSSATKAYLLDMTFTEVDRCDYELERASGVKQYFILRHFQQQIPLIFKKGKQNDMEKYYQLFNSYIKYNRLREYPPIFSRIMKLYTMEEIKSNISRKKYAQDILSITDAVFDTEEKESQSILKMVYLQSRKEKLRLDSELKSSQIRDYFKILHCSDHLIKVFERYSDNRLISKLDYLEKPMSQFQFSNFLINQQKQSKEKIEYILSIMKETVNFYQFCSFIENQKVNHAAQAIQIDENLPLTDYFCYSSHNTYLSGNQLTSDCKIQRYLQDLQRGLKCVEIDIHNDGDTPIISHALGDRSLCTPINFEETIKQIVNFCEINTKHYPIILSIQNHAKEENRYKVSNILIKYLSNRIFFIDQAYPFEDPIIFKTLKELRGKVIIKTDSRLSEISSFKKKSVFEVKSNVLKLYSPQPNFPSVTFQQSYNKFQQTIKKLIKRKEDFDYSIPNSLFLPISEMTKVTGIFKAGKGIETINSLGCQCTSLTNEKAIKVKEDFIVDYTKRSFLRIYPIGTEISSSNYDPAPHLKIGAQIIALNTQTKDDYAWMMMSYFKAGRIDSTENIGYIQKPIHLRTNRHKQLIKKNIEIQIISKTKNISIEFYGSQRDMKMNSKRKTNVFYVLDYDEGFLMFKINQTLKECIPVRFIREGYRVLVAKNNLFKDSGIRVIIHIKISQEKL